MKTPINPLNKIAIILTLMFSSCFSYAYEPYLVKDINPYFDAPAFPSGGGIGQLTVVNQTLFFVANDGDNGYEIWKSNATEAGTVLVTELLLGPEPVYSFEGPNFLTDSGNLLFFNFNDPTAGFELFSSDGSASGTGMVIDINPTGDSSPRFLMDFNGVLLFSARDENGESGLWRSDGTVPGTFRLRSDMFYTGHMGILNDIAYFMGRDVDRGQELWRTDGTEQGTYLVRNVTDLDAGGSPYAFTPMGNEMFYAGSSYDLLDNYNGVELWKTDGTSSGTVMVKDISPGFGNSLPEDKAALDGLLYFSASDTLNGTGETGHDLWISDGTEIGTQKIKVFNTYLYSITKFTAVNHTMFFVTDDSAVEAGIELWKSDGTELGTALVRSFHEASSVDELMNINGTLFFVVDGVIWTSDGTEIGTVPIIPDLSTEEGSIGQLTLNGNTLFFVGDIHPIGTIGVGSELWALDVTPPGLDSDGDGFLDENDNCPSVFNPDQFDTDLDGMGDECDPFPQDPNNDVDGDGFGANEDNCPNVYNPTQVDSDGDGIGDACELSGPDSDGDGFDDASDNCPNTFNPDQADKDGDGWGDVCDIEGKYGNNDSDSDGWVNRKDNCPHIFNDDQADSDGNGIGDACDTPTDTDNDGYYDSQDNCPMVANPFQEDLDGDNIGDACDDDMDGDGYHNKRDKCPLEGTGPLDRHGCPV